MIFVEKLQMLISVKLSFFETPCIIIKLEGMHFGPPWTPGGCQGVSVGPRIVTFLGATFGFQIVNFFIVGAKNTLFFRFLAKNSSSGGQKWSFWAKHGVYESGFFSKTPSFICPKSTGNRFLGHIRGGKSLVPLIH